MNIFPNDSFRKYTSFGLWILGIAFPILSLSYGITWDEEDSISYSIKILDYYTSFGENDALFDLGIGINSHLIYYGNLFGLLSSILVKIIPVDIVILRHLLNAILGFAIILFAVKLARIFNNERVAFLTMILLVLSPRFFGLAMNDFRDTAFAAGFIASAFYIIILCTDLPQFKMSSWVKLIIAISFTCGIRIVGIILFGFLVLSILIKLYYLRKAHINITGIILKTIRFGLLSFAIVYFLIVITWPFAIQDPFGNPLKALLQFSNLKLSTFHQLYLGQLISSAEIPWHYLPVWMAITIPIITLLGFIVFIIFKIGRDKTPTILMLLAFVVIPILMSMGPNTNIYDGWRHYLFLCPFIAISSAIGWDFAFSHIKRSSIYKIVLGIFLGLLALPIRSMIVYHPNQHVYFNELVGGIKGAYGYFEVDTYANVVRFGVEWLNKNVESKSGEKLIFASNNNAFAFQQYGRKDLFRKDVNWLRVNETFRTPWDYAIITPRKLSSTVIKNGLWPPKETIYSLEIEGVPIMSVLKRQERGLLKAAKLLKERKFNEALNYMHWTLDFYNNKEEALGLIGRTFYDLKMYQEAKSSLKKSIKILPENPEALFYLGLVYLDTKNYTEAQLAFEKSMKYQSNGFNAMYYLAKTYEQQTLFSKAIEWYEYLIEIGAFRSKQSWTILFMDYAICLMNYGDLNPSQKRTHYQKSEKALLQITKMYPDFRPAYYKLKALYIQSDQKNQAEKYNAYIKSNFEN